jgi:hypothetical protein
MTFDEIDAVNKAARALNLGLAGMTHERWSRLSFEEKRKLQDLSGLSPQLLKHEGYRVEVVDGHGCKRRFWVSRSTGWRPCHIELKLRSSSGGQPADPLYLRVTRTSNHSRIFDPYDH